MILVTSPGHARHHVRQRGYLESPARVDALLRGVLRSENIRPQRLRHFHDRHVTDVHSPDLLSFLRKSCAASTPGRYEYPYLYPPRFRDRPPRDWSLGVGYYCFDSFTPIHRHAFVCARQAVDAALTAADAIVRGAGSAYALIRPPGHHAERNRFGGFCYLNSSAIAAHYLSRQGRVAMLDLDYHHGNGAQNIFWERDDVLTVSIHGAPAIAYPYFAGFEDERGAGKGDGFNLNLPLPERQQGAQYSRALRRALGVVRDFAPDFLVVPIGFDTGKGDPTGSWSLTRDDLHANGSLVARLNLPTLFVQEGGYRIRSLATLAGAFFTGFGEN